MNRFSFPLALAKDPTESFVFVVSSNFDQAWRGGTIVPVRVSDNKKIPEAGIEIGSFASQMVLFQSESGEKGFVTVRDGNVIQFFDIVRDEQGLKLKCGEGGTGDGKRCGSSNEKPFESDVGGELSVQTDLYGLCLGSVGSAPVLYVASIHDGTLGVFDISSDGSLGKSASVLLRAGLHSIVEGRETDNKRIVYVTNRQNNIVHIVDVWTEDNNRKFLERGGISVPQVTTSGDYFRGAQISVDRKLLYVAFNSPPSLAVFEVLEDGWLSLRGLVPVGGAPSEVAVARIGGRDLVFVSDFTMNSIHCVDPYDLKVKDRIHVGAGPYGMVLLGSEDKGFLRLYVALFEDNEVDVVDVLPSSETWHQVVARIR
jgi:DNA-binding beta-propeller fold protein YncE